MDHNLIGLFLLILQISLFLVLIKGLKKISYQNQILLYLTLPFFIFSFDFTILFFNFQKDHQKLPINFHHLLILRFLIYHQKLYYLKYLIHTL